jgi:hypothetical protein
VIILADENIDRPIIDRLRLDGHTVISIFETGRGMTDEDVLKLSDSEKAVLLTEEK